MDGFHEIRFPEDVSWGSSGGPIYKTQIFTSFRGYEKRNTDWSQPMMRFNVAYGIKTDLQMLSMLEFFNARQGMANGFRYKNWCNYQITGKAFATGDGESTRLPIWKFYGFDGARHYKRLRKIVRGSVTGVQIGAEPVVEGVDFTIDYDAGEIAFNTIPSYALPIRCQTLEFDEPVRFTTDRIQAVIDSFDNQSLSRLELISVRGAFSAGSVFAPGQGSTLDPFYDQTILALNFDDSGDPTTTVDQSAYAFPVTLSGTARLTRTAYQHGNSSLLLGSAGRCALSGSLLLLENEPFTLEGFFTQPLDGEVIQPMLAKWEAPTSRKSFALRYNFARSRIEFVITTDGATETTILSYPWDSARGTFDHISVDRLPSNWYVLRINGIVVQTVRNNLTIRNNTSLLTIGGYTVEEGGESPYQGNIDSIRITLGRNRTAGFEKGKIPSPGT